MNENFAAEPATCDSSIELKHLLEKFGPATGRYLAKYPAQRWEQLLFTHIADWTQLEQERAKVSLRRAKEGMALVRAGGVVYQNEDSWLQNVERTQRTQSCFDGVVVSRSHAGAYPSLDDLDLPPTAAEPVVANSREYVRVSRRLLSHSPELHFIDPYLDPCNADRKVVLQEMLGVAAGGNCQSAFIWVREKELKRPLAETTSALGRMARHAGFLRPRLLQLRAFTDACRSTKVHDRYLLSLHGAIRFEHGFQQLTGRRTANVAPESRKNHDELLRLFHEGEHDLGVENIEIDLSST